eukprot:7164935-Karenia_brevis.AAC.1
MRQSGLQSNHGLDLGIPCRADKSGSACCWWLDDEWAEQRGDFDSTSEDGASGDVMTSEFAAQD